MLQLTASTCRDSLHRPQHPCRQGCVVPVCIITSVCRLCMDTRGPAAGPEHQGWSPVPTLGPPPACADSSPACHKLEIYFIFFRQQSIGPSTEALCGIQAPAHAWSIRLAGNLNAARLYSDANPSYDSIPQNLNPMQDQRQEVLSFLRLARSVGPPSPTEGSPGLVRHSPGDPSRSHKSPRGPESFSHLALSRRIPQRIADHITSLFAVRGDAHEAQGQVQPDILARGRALPCPSWCWPWLACCLGISV